MDDTAAPISEHLAELRNRIIWVLAVWAVASLASFNFAEPIFGLLLEPAVAALGPENGTERCCGYHYVEQKAYADYYYFGCA